MDAQLHKNHGNTQAGIPGGIANAGPMAAGDHAPRAPASRRGIWFGGFVIASLAAHGAVAGVLLIGRDAPTPLPVVTVELDLRLPGGAGQAAPTRRAAKPGLATRTATAGQRIAEKKPKTLPRPPKPAAKAAKPKLKPPADKKLASPAQKARPPSQVSKPIQVAKTASPAPAATARMYRAVSTQPVVLRPARPLNAKPSKQEIARFHKALPNPRSQWQAKARRQARRTVARAPVRKSRHTRQPPRQPPRQPHRQQPRQVASRASAGAPAGAVVPPRPAGGFGGNPTPHYPAEARDNGWEGRVVLHVRVNAAGRPDGVRVSRSSGFSVLDAAARRAVRRWRFRPASQAGVAVAASVLIPIRFRLRR